MASSLVVGDRVRAKVRTMFGWKGTGTVVDIVGDDIVVRKDGSDDTALFCPHELTKIRAMLRGAH